MYEDEGYSGSAWNTSHWSLVALVTVCAILAGLALWWLESRFGARIAVMTFGGLSGVVIFAFGARFNQNNTGVVLKNFADTVHALQPSRTAEAKVFVAQAGIEKEHARLQREEAGAEAKIKVLEYKEILRLAQQHAREIEQSKAHLMLADQQAEESWENAPDEDESDALQRYDWG